MPGLTDIALRKLKPRDKPYKLFDSQGLFLLVKPSGATYWRMKYTLAGKQNTIALGVYPEVSLSQARHRRDEERQLLADNIDPALNRKLKLIADQNAKENTFFTACRRALSQEGT